MKLTHALMIGASVLGLIRTTAYTQSSPPFTLSLEEVTYPDWPGLHSFVSGEWEGRRLVMCGRTGGLHGFLPPNPFTPLEANKEVWMFEPETGAMWEASTDGLPSEVQAQLQSTNPQAFQRGQYLYIIGGYGREPLGTDMVTFPTLTAVDLQALAEALEAGTEIAGAFRSISDPMLEITGGEVGMIGDTIYVFGGHSFTGEYSKPAGPQFTQVYTNQLTSFTLTDDGEVLSIDNIHIRTDTIAFHRRDLNFEPMMQADGSPALIALSGVFQYESDAVWYEPVIVTDTGYVVDEAFMQKMNNYTCPVISMYDAPDGTNYHTLLGGISQNWYDESDGTLIEDLNVPFVNDITTIIRAADGLMEQFIQPVTLSGLLGSNAEFWVSADVPVYENGVIKLHEITTETCIGYMFGGIDALIPNFTPSTASNVLLKVCIVPDEEISIAQQEMAGVRVFPNPAQNQISFRNQTGKVINTWQITDAVGNIVMSGTENMLPGYQKTVQIADLSTGIYFIQFRGDDEVFLGVCVKM